MQFSTLYAFFGSQMTLAQDNTSHRLKNWVQDRGEGL
jgi:hypothetical protein